MKKIFLLFAVLTLSVSVLFAEKEKYLAATFAFSHEKFTPDNVDFSVNNFDFGLSSMSISDDGFSLLWELDIGKTSSSDIYPSGFDDYTFNADFKFGMGKALPTFLDKLVIVAHGFVGLGGKLGVTESKDSSYRTADRVYEISEDCGFASFNINLGADARLIYKATKHFGLFAGLDFYVPLYSINYINHHYEVELRNSYGYRDSERNNDSSSYSGFGGFGFATRIGFCIIY